MWEIVVIESEKQPKHKVQKRHQTKKYRKAVRWCTRVNCRIYWSSILIWIFFLLYLWADWIGLDPIFQLKIMWDVVQNLVYHICRFMPKILYMWLVMLGIITPEPKYLIVANFMRYYTRITKSYDQIFDVILQILWSYIWCDITTELQYLLVADFERY